MEKRDRREVPSFATLLRPLRSLRLLHVGAVFAVALSFYTTWSIFDTTAFLSRATATASGSVVSSSVVSIDPDVAPRGFCQNTITFQAADGKSITFVDRGSSCFVTTLTVLYDPSHPDDARSSDLTSRTLTISYLFDGIFLLTIARYAIKGRRQKGLSV